MRSTSSLVSQFTPAIIWLARHPNVVQVALITLSIVVALLAGLASHGTALACSPAGGGGGPCYN
jgi:hypothetical protein